MILTHNLTLRKVDRRAMEQNEDVCAAHQFHMGFEYHPNQLVFVDESSCDRRLSWEYSRAARGHCVIKKTVFVWGKRYMWPTKLSGQSSFSDIWCYLQSHLMGYLTWRYLKVCLTQTLLRDSSMASFATWIHFWVQTPWSPWITVRSTNPILSMRWLKSSKPSSATYLTRSHICPVVCVLNSCPPILLTIIQLNLHSQSLRCTSNQERLSSRWWIRTKRRWKSIYFY